MTFDEHCSAVLYSLEFQFLHHMVADIRKVSRLSSLDNGPYTHYNVQSSWQIGNSP